MNLLKKLKEEWIKANNHESWLIKLLIKGAILIFITSFILGMIYFLSLLTGCTVMKNIGQAITPSTTMEITFIEPKTDNETGEMEKPGIVEEDKIRRKFLWFSWDAYKWTKKEKWLEGGFMFFHLIDMLQTKYAMDRPERFHEANPALPNHLNDTELFLFGTGVPAAHCYIADKLDHDKRQLWQWIGIGLKLIVTFMNKGAECRIEF